MYSFKQMSNKKDMEDRMKERKQFCWVRKISRQKQGLN